MTRVWKSFGTTIGIVDLIKNHQGMLVSDHFLREQDIYSFKYFPTDHSGVTKGIWWIQHNITDIIHLDAHTHRGHTSHV